MNVGEMLEIVNDMYSYAYNEIQHLELDEITEQRVIEALRAALEISEETIKTRNP